MTTRRIDLRRRCRLLRSADARDRRRPPPPGAPRAPSRNSGSVGAWLAWASSRSRLIRPARSRRARPPHGDFAEHRIERACDPRVVSPRTAAPGASSRLGFRPGSGRRRPGIGFAPQSASRRDRSARRAEPKTPAPDQGPTPLSGAPRHRNGCSRALVDQHPGRVGCHASRASPFHAGCQVEVSRDWSAVRVAFRTVRGRAPTTVKDSSKSS